MAILGSYFLNGPSLGSSTTIFTNSNLTTIAPDGFYSDGVTSREQVSGVLLPAVTCGSCGTPCGSSISGSGATGIYLLNLEAGGSSFDTGAIIIRFNPFSVPDGIRATYNGNIYNALTSPVNGFHRSTNPANFTVIGASSADCGLAGNTSNFPTMTEYLFNGTSFIATGNTQNITINPGDVSLSVSAPGNCMMVIPKPTAAPSIVNFQFVGPCSSTGWDVDVACPELLTGFGSSVMASTSAGACLLLETVTYYNASLANTPGIVGLYDFVFSDAYGSNPLAAGFYHATGSITGSNDWFQVDSNGVVIALGVCTGTTCLEYTVATTAAQAQLYTYTDCEGNPQQGYVGGVGGYDANTFCAQENTVVGTGETTTTLNGPCTI